MKDLSQSAKQMADKNLREILDTTEEELDFIINYDIKYRMGKNEEEEEQ